MKHSFASTKVGKKEHLMHISLLYAHKFLIITSLSLLSRVGRSIWIWETCKVYSDPARVAEFFMTQVTSSPFTSLTCIMKSKLIEWWWCTNDFEYMQYSTFFILNLKMLPHKSYMQISEHMATLIWEETDQTWETKFPNFRFLRN